MSRIDPIRRTASVVLIAAAQVLNAQSPSTTGLIQLDQPSALVVRLAEFMGDTPVARVAVSRLEGLVGTYSPVAADRPATFTIKGGRLVVLVSGLRDTPLFAASDSTFYALTASRFKVMFYRTARGPATSVDVSVNGVTHRATRQ